MEKPPLVSIIVGVRNMEVTIGSCIESLLKQDYPSVEIIIIDDGSDDSTPEIIQKYPIRLIRTEKRGISHARNFGYLEAQGEFIAYTDADCTVIPSWLSAMMPHFQDPKVALIGGMTIFQTDGSISSLYRQVEFQKRNENTLEGEVFWAGGAGCVFRKKALDEIGGFNPQWAYGEDAEISFMISENGYKILKEPKAISYHVPESGFKRLIRKGYRDGSAYMRATLFHVRKSLKNRFNTTWYLPYDVVFQPMLYAILIMAWPVLLLLQILFSSPIFFILTLVSFVVFLFLVIYSFLPAKDVSRNTPTNHSKLKFFWGSSILHILRGFAWGFGLLFGTLKAIKIKLSS